MYVIRDSVYLKIIVVFAGFDRVDGRTDFIRIQMCENGLDLKVFMLHTRDAFIENNSTPKI